MSSPKDSRWYSTPAAARKRKPLGLTLPAEVLERLERMASACGVSRSQAIEMLVMTTPIRTLKRRHRDVAAT